MALEDCFLYIHRKALSPVRVLFAKYTPQRVFDYFVLPNERINGEGYGDCLFQLVLQDKEGNEHRTPLMPREEVSSIARRIVRDLRGKLYNLDIEIHESLFEGDKQDKEHINNEEDRR